MKGTQTVQTLRGTTVRFQIEVGTWEKHVVEVTYGKTLRLLRVRIDGRVVYRHWDLVPWPLRRATEFKTPGREAHTLMVEPPGAPANRGSDRDNYVLWLDGQPLLRIERR